jgi:hypothetical protein
VALLLTLFLAHDALAQTKVTASEAAAIHHARIKIWTGITLMAVGAIALPITATDSTRQDNRGPVLVSLGAIGAGSGLVYLGFRQQQRAAAPSTSVGFAVGGIRGVVIRRSW